MKTTKILAVSAVLVSALAFASQGVILKYAYKKGDTTKTKLQGKIDLMGQEVEVVLTSQDTVTEIAEDGSITLKNETLEGKAIVGGQEIDIPASPATLIVMKPTGEIKELRGDDISGGQYRVQNLMSFVPPTTAVQVGTKWTREGKSDKDKGSVAFKVESEIVAEEKVSDWDTFKINYKAFETEGDEAASMEGTLWINKSDCSLVKAKSKWKNVPLAGAPAPINGEFSITREK